MTLIDELKQFTYNSYVNLIEHLSEYYNVISFNQVHEEKKPYLIIRHDVDASIDHAIKFAELVEKLAKIYWGALQIGEPENIPNEHLGRFEKLYQSLFANYPRSMRGKKG